MADAEEKLLSTAQQRQIRATKGHMRLRLEQARADHTDPVLYSDNTVTGRWWHKDRPDDPGPTAVTVKRDGVSGWFDYANTMSKVHICGRFPCPSGLDPPHKYKDGECPLHALFVDFVVDGEAAPAVLNETQPSCLGA